MTTQAQADAAARQVEIEKAAGINSTAATATPASTPTPTPTAPVSSPIAPSSVPTPTAVVLPTSTGDAGTDAITGLQSFGDTPQGQSMLNDINTLTNKLASGVLSPEEQASVQEQADATRAQYDQLVAQAKQQKQQGMAKDIVGAGQRGGLMNTQFAGVAAVAPVNGGSFIGAGGELNRIQSEYDLNIQNIRAQQIQAVSETQRLAKEAIRTGRKEDLQAAEDAFTLAKSLNDDHNAMVAEKVKALADYKTQQLQYQQYARETASGTIDAMVKSGLDPATVPDDVFASIDAQGGYVPGTAKGMMEVSRAEAEAQSAKDQIDQADKLVGILTKLPVGQSINIGGTDYMSLQTGSLKTFSADDGDGNTTLTTLNEDTGEMTSHTLYGVSKKDGWTFQQNNGVGLWVNPNTQQVQVAFDGNQPNNGVAQGGLIDAFPEGSVTPFTRSSGGLDRASECGAWVNDITGIGVGNSYQSKVDKMDASIDETNSQIGDVFIEKAGTTGHIGIINSKSVVNGQVMYTVSESNWSKQPGTDGKIGIITHTRQVPASEITGYARPGFKDPSYNFGTDSVTPNTQEALKNYAAKPGEDQKIVKIDGQDYVLNPTTGQYEKPNIAGAATAANPVVDSAMTSLAQIKKIRESPGFNNAVGQSGTQRFSGFRPGRDTAFIGLVRKLTNTDVLDELINAKAQGATFGALSEGELNLLKESANTISGWEKKDKDGNVVGYKVNQKTFKAALDDLEAKYNDAIAKAGGTVPATSSTSTLQPLSGEIMVKDRMGNIFSLPPGEFDASIYTKL